MRSKRTWWKISLVLALAAIVLVLRFKGIIFTSVHPAFNLLESQRISRRIAGYKVLDDKDFYIQYNIKDKDAAYSLQSIANSWGSEVLNFFQYEHSEQVGIVLYSREEELKGVLRIPQGQSALGAYAGGKINLLSPDSLSSMNQGSDSLVNVFVHELAHLVVDDIGKGNYPLWFTEGSALYLEYDLLDYEWGSGLDPNNMSSLDDLTYYFSSLDEDMAYRESFLLVKGLIGEYGRDSYVRFLHDLGEGKEFNAALMDIYGITTLDVQKYVDL